MTDTDRYTLTAWAALDGIKHEELSKAGQKACQENYEAHMKWAKGGKLKTYYSGKSWLDFVREKEK